MDWACATAEDTEAFGGRLAMTRPAASGFSTVHLLGDLGAGKTTLARGFLRACGVTGTVRSPTYTLMEVYETPGLSIVHLDLYRLIDAHDLEGVGLREWALPGHLFLVEWPERGTDRVPPADLAITLREDSSAHHVNLKACSALGVSWLQAVEKSLRAP